jgi:dTDP-4-amino-4,6-dideoxygalactose transaminase
MFHENANEIIKQTGWAKHYPLLHKTTYYNSSETLTNTEKIHPYILNIPLHKKINLDILNAKK